MSFQELHSAIAAFRETFGCEPVACGYAPGRVNLIGDHTDYNDGFVFPMAIPVGTIVLGCHTDSTTTTILTLSDVGDKQIAFENKEIKADAENRTWVNYVKGVIALFPHQPVRPFNAVISSNVPLGAGLSSSAALEVAFFHFLEALSGNNITDLSIAEKATICQQAEHDFAGVPCGIMDQVVSFGGKEGQALLIDCRSTTIEYIPITNNDVVFVVTDSHVKHEHAGGEYKNRRRACEQVASLLGKTSLRDISMRELESSQSVLSEELYRIGRHVITENERTIDAAEALKRNDIRTFGTLMTQVSVRCVSTKCLLVVFHRFV